MYSTKYKHRHIAGNGEGNLLLYNMWSEYLNIIFLSSNAGNIYIAITWERCKPCSWAKRWWKETHKC